MKKKALILILLATSYDIYAVKETFLAKQNGQVIAVFGKHIERHSPCSTFKIPLSLMAYNENILFDEETPIWPYCENYYADRKVCKRATGPRGWIDNSIVWYSQEIVKKLGNNIFKEYVELFKYGNCDITKENSWLSSSLKISVEEQVAFLEKFLANNLGLEPHVYKKTRTLLFQGQCGHGFDLYGKTGSGREEKSDIGWFIGWLEKSDSVIIFAYFIEVESCKDILAGEMAKKMSKERLREVINKAL